METNLCIRTKTITTPVLSIGRCSESNKQSVVVTDDLVSSEQIESGNIKITESGNSNHMRMNSSQRVTGYRMTSQELLSIEFPEPNWVVPGLIPVGLINLSGRPKVGKSILMLQLAIAKGDGGLFLGRSITRGRVLYIDLENSESRMQFRAHKLKMTSKTDIQFQFGGLILNNNGIDKLRKDIENDHLGLVIIDTFSRASRGFDQMKMGVMTSIVGDLQKIAMSNNMSIILIDHHRKPNEYSGDPNDDILGTTGKSAPADTVLGLYRNNRDHGATLKIVGRDIDDIKIGLNWDANEFIWKLGDINNLYGNSRKGKILSAMKELISDGELATSTNLAKKIGLDKSNVCSDLGEMVKDGIIIPGEKKGRDKPYYLAEVNKTKL